MFFFRDKELEINQIEQDRHCMREKRDGKHYLIESYLKGLPDITKNGNLFISMPFQHFIFKTYLQKKPKFLINLTK